MPLDTEFDLHMPLGTTNPWALPSDASTKGSWQHEIGGYDLRNHILLDDSAIGRKCLVFWVSLVDLVVYILAIQPMNQWQARFWNGVPLSGSWWNAHTRQMKKPRCGNLALGILWIWKHIANPKISTNGTNVERLLIISRASSMNLYPL